MDKHRDTRSYDRRDQDPRGRRGGATRRKRKKHGRAFKVVMTIVLIFVITLAMLLCMSAAYIKNVIIPDASLDMSDFNPNLTSKVLAQNPETGTYETVQTLYGEENRVWVSTDEIPQYLKDAAVAIEDKRFYKHNGVDWVRTAKAISLMFTGRSIQGGSTLTQQLVKNLTNDKEVTVRRKLVEIFRALEMEKQYSKETTSFLLKEKIADMIKYGKKAVANFPRRERQTADEIRRTILNMYRLSITIEKKYYKKTTLQDLDIELDVLRHLIRLAQDKDYYDQNIAPPLSFHKYEVWSGLLNEIGRIIGGYMKYAKQ